MRNKMAGKESLIKRVFKEELPTIGNNLVSATFAIGARTGFSNYAPEFMESDAAISAVATAIDVGFYWVTFLPQLLYRDRNKIKDENGKINSKKLSKKLAEYDSMAGIVELMYATGSFTGQYLLQKNGVDPVNASLIIQRSSLPLFTAIIPFIRYGLRQWSEK